MKHTLLILVLILGTTLSSVAQETFKANIASRDSIYCGFGSKHVQVQPDMQNGDTIAGIGIREVEFKAGDTLWVYRNGSRNGQFKRRYREMFIPVVIINGEVYPGYAGDSLVPTPMFGDAQYGVVTNYEQYYATSSGSTPIEIATGPLWTGDMTIQINWYPLNKVVANFVYDTNICTIFPALEVIPVPEEYGFTCNYLRFPCTDPPQTTVTIVPNDSYKIKSIVIDTNQYLDMNPPFEYDEHIKYYADAPENSNSEGWIQENENGIIKLTLKGYTEYEDGILYPMYTKKGATSSGGYGYHVEVITEPKNSIDETPTLHTLISPNPTSNYLNVELAEIHQSITAEVLDLSGKVLFKMNFENAQNFRINFPFALTNGTYMLHLNADGRRSYTNFIIAK